VVGATGARQAALSRRQDAVQALQRLAGGFASVPAAVELALAQQPAVRRRARRRAAEPVRA
jgi:hypothetical protein